MDFRLNDAAQAAASADGKAPLPIAQPVAACTIVQGSAVGMEPVTAVAVPITSTSITEDGRQGPAGSWHDGFCDCCNDYTTCCVALWCPCIVLGQLRHVLGIGGCDNKKGL